MPSDDAFSLFLFSTDPAFVARAAAAGVSGFIVDWEHAGKAQRQMGADTEINRHTVADLRRVRAATDALVICRLNSVGPGTAAEMEQAIDAGADEILLPMVRSPEEAEMVLWLADARCGVGVLIETRAAVARAAEFAALPLARVYVGLNDLAIERRSPTIFDAVADGTVERLRRHFTAPFGFGGLTLPDRGTPIPCRLLIGEMARLGCTSSFLRRSFHRDMHGRDPALEVPRLLAALRQAAARDLASVVRDRLELEDAIGAWASSADSVEMRSA